MRAFTLRAAFVVSTVLAGAGGASSATDCLACTPGMASGGGQVQDSMAELAILTESGAKGRASFDFDVRFATGDQRPGGDLTYIDHGSGTTARSESIDSLAITSNKAIFSGRAAVNRTSTQTFTVEVEDLGEPGKADAFRILLSGDYAAGSVLLHGNIEVREGEPPPEAGVPPNGLFQQFFGSIHNHTAYSDGEGRPEDAFATGKAADLNYLFLTEHSEWLDFPFQASEDCLEPQNTLACEAAPPPGKTEWQDVEEQGRLASDPPVPYLGLRGFEWSSPTLGHANVLLSSNYMGNGPTAPTMDAFWDWFLLDKDLGGGSDGLAIFNHPSREQHPVEAMRTFEDFRYVADADARVIGLEVFNRGEDYSACFVRALGKGWHLGAIGAADNHEDWGRADRSRTALLVDLGRSDSFSPEAAREALEVRRFYATFDHNLIVSLKADGSWMGSRLEREPGQAITLSFQAADHDPGDRIRRVELYGSGMPEPACDRDQRDAAGDRKTVLKATPLAAADFDSETASLELSVVPAVAKESWYFAKIIQADGQTAYTSPIWVRVPEGAPTQGTWIAGDLHAHTVYSHDVCNPAHPTSEQCANEPWTTGFTPAQQIALAESRGLGFLALTDHNTVDHLSDPGYAGYAGPVVLVPGQELSLHGHANVLGYAGDVQNRRGSSSAEEVEGSSTKSTPAAVSSRSTIRRNRAGVTGASPGYGR